MLTSCPWCDPVNQPFIPHLLVLWTPAIDQQLRVEKQQRAIVPTVTSAVLPVHNTSLLGSSMVNCDHRLYIWQEPGLEDSDQDNDHLNAKTMQLSASSKDTPRIREQNGSNANDRQQRRESQQKSWQGSQHHGVDSNSNRRKPGRECKQAGTMCPAWFCHHPTYRQVCKLLQASQCGALVQRESGIVLVLPHICAEGEWLKLHGKGIPTPCIRWRLSFHCVSGVMSIVFVS